MSEVISLEINEIRSDLHAYNASYYMFEVPAISDVEYDKMFKRLQELEDAHPEYLDADSPTQSVGHGRVVTLEQIAHPSRMLSIDNGFDMETMDTFHARCTKKLGYEPTYAVEWKVDGCALNLVYEDGVLVSAISRGDGTAGDDITAPAMEIIGVPRNLNYDPALCELWLRGTLEVRGEAFIPHSDFRGVVAMQEKNGQEPFKNSRSATAGALRRLNPMECRRRKVHFVAHGIGVQSTGATHSAYSISLAKLAERGMPVLSRDVDGYTYVNAVAHMKYMADKHTRYYPIDGIVLKVNSFEDRVKLGQESSRHVSWAMAYKWERYEATTKIVKLETQVGKQGTLTPVAYYEPVEIAETTVSKSTLFNFDEVARLDPRVGDVVIVEKAGKIIPHLVSVCTGKRTEDLEKFVPPTACPVCSGPVGRDGANYVCVNHNNCPAQLEAVILAAADRSRLDIDGLGPVAVQSMIAAGAITTFIDLWTLRDTVDEAGAIPGLTANKSKKLLAAIEKSKSQPSWRLLASLNIKHVGRTNSKLLCEHIAESTPGTKTIIAELMVKSIEGGLEEVAGVGCETAHSLSRWFSSNDNKVLLLALGAAGANMGSRDPKKATAPTGPQPLAGKSVCATGKLQDFTRDSVKEAIIAAGGKPASSVSGKTDYLVAGADAGSKLAKAQKLGVAVLTEAEFKELIGS